MHVLVCGLGSIGRRHLRHFRVLGATQVDAYRTGKATLPDAGQPAPDRVFHNLDEALAEHPDIVVISNPTSLHVPTARAAVAAGCHVLVEKPLSNDLAGCSELATEARRSGIVFWVACNMRFHPVLGLLKSLVQADGPLGEPIIARFHFGADLESWHPWEDALRSYAGRRDLGGGVALTHIHEIDAALWLFGPAEQTRGLALGKRPLGTDVAEGGGLLVRHCGGSLSAITLSFVQRPPSRTIDVSFEKGTFSGDLAAARWTIRHTDGRVEQGADEGFDWERTYAEQAEAFLRAVRGQAPVLLPVEEAVAALQIALSLEAA